MSIVTVLVAWYFIFIHQVSARVSQQLLNQSDQYSVVVSANGWESNQLEVVFNQMSGRQFNQTDELYIAGRLSAAL